MCSPTRKMAEFPDEALEVFLRHLNADDLIAVLLELAQEHESVPERQQQRPQRRT